MFWNEPVNSVALSRRRSIVLSGLLKISYQLSTLYWLWKQRRFIGKTFIYYKTRYNYKTNINIENAEVLSAVKSEDSDFNFQDYIL